MDEMNEKVKPITLTDEKGNAYTLEFDRNALVTAERRGFVLEELSKFPATRIPELFYYAFQMHHKGITRQTTDKLLEGIGTLPDGFLERLVQLYAVPLNTLTTGASEKNVTVTVEM